MQKERGLTLVNAPEKLADSLLREAPESGEANFGAVQAASVDAS